MDWEQAAQEIKARIVDGALTDEDIRLALDIEANAREVWDRHVWLRALGGWTAGIDEDAVRYLRGEVAAEE